MSVRVNQPLLCLWPGLRLRLRQEELQPGRQLLPLELGLW